MTKITKYKNKKTWQIVHVTTLLGAERAEFIDLWIVTTGSFTFTSEDWEEMREKLEFKDIWDKIGFYYRFDELHTKVGYPPSTSTTIYPTEKLAIATEALRKLLRLRHEITEGREPDLKDGKIKYCITNFKDQADACEWSGSNCPLSFPTERVRDAFMRDYKDLIEKALPLL